MSFLSRREFFKHFKNDLADQVDVSAVNHALSQISQSNGLIKSESWVEIGRIAQFTPGLISEVKVNLQLYFIHSIAEGFWVEDKSNKRVALKTEQGGKVWANVAMEWPKNRMISHITGEAVDLELQLETRTTGEGK